MDNDLNKFFVTINIFEGENQVHSVSVPKSNIHDVFLKYKYPGSIYDLKVIDHTGNYRINSKIVQFK